VNKIYKKEDKRKDFFMNNTKQNTPFYHILLGSWFGMGKMPIASGTWGSLLALPFAWYIIKYSGFLGLGAMSVIITLVGWWVTENVIKNMENKDPSLIVIDEVAGQWIALLPASLNIYEFVLAFVFFRFFDILKPWPACWADSKLKGSLGVMLDDVFAGFYAALCIILLQKYYPSIFELNIIDNLMRY
jgi:phosphatidylglycerophosphatase A